MAILGSVTDTPTAGTIAAPVTRSVQLPSANLTIVGIAIFNSAVLIEVPIDSSKFAIFSQGGGSQQIDPMFRVTWTVDGQTLNYNNMAGAGTVVFYYGTALPNSKPLKAYAGSVLSNTFSATGSATLNFTFPKDTKISGVEIPITQTANTNTGNGTIAWQISSGKTITIPWAYNIHMKDDQVVLIEMLPVGVSGLAVTVTCTSLGASTSTVVYVIIYYVI